MNNINQNRDLIYRDIAEKYIQDEDTRVIFHEQSKTGTKIIVIGSRDGQTGYINEDTINVFAGETWKQAFVESGYYGGLLDQDDDYFKNWCSDYTDEEMEVILNDRRIMQNAKNKNLKTMKQFIDKWNGRTIEDDGCYASDEFKEIANDFHDALKEEMRNRDAEMPHFRVGHYDLSCMLEKNRKFIYISFSVPRRYLPVDLDRSDCFLYRTAENAYDYHGGHNNFCNASELIDEVDELFKKQGA